MREVAVEEIAAVLRDPARAFRLTTHRNPDGDALGSMLGLARALRAAGRDVVMWHCENPAIPEELAFLGEEVVGGGQVPDAAERTLIAVDCASADRVGADPRTLGAVVVNIDHHHDNTRFGDLNLVDGAASSTAEMLVRVLDAAGLPLSPAAAAALYVGIVTDTGRFAYANVGPGTFRAAASLVAAGIDIAGLSRALYEDRPVERARLAARALELMRLTAGDRVATSLLTVAEFAACGTDETDGIVEDLRALRGVRAAALVCEVPSAPGTWRVSMRSRDGGADVSAVARGFGGGGHHAAAGCTLAGVDGVTARDRIEAALAEAL